MPRFYVQLDNNKWRVWSTIVDGWVTDPFSFDELKAFRRRQAIEKADADTNSLLTDRPHINKMEYKELIERYTPTKDMSAEDKTFCETMLKEIQEG